MVRPTVVSPFRLSCLSKNSKLRQAPRRPPVPVAAETKRISDAPSKVVAAHSLVGSTSGVSYLCAAPPLNRVPADQNTSYLVQVICDPIQKNVHLYASGPDAERALRVNMIASAFRFLCYRLCGPTSLMVTLLHRFPTAVQTTSGSAHNAITDIKCLSRVWENLQ